MTHLLTMDMDSDAVSTADPTGEFRRNGFTGKGVQLPISYDGRGSEWAKKTLKQEFRVCALRNRLYMREFDPAYFGGYRILYVPIGGRGIKIAKEWLS